MSIQIEDGMRVDGGDIDSGDMSDGDISAHRFEGYDLATKYGWMQTGEGPEAVRRGVQSLHELSARYRESGEQLHRQLAALNLSWRGGSADAAAGAMTTLAAWASRAGDSAAEAGGGMDGYGQSFARMKPRIPNPADAGPQSGGGRLLDAAMGVAGSMTGLESAQARRLAALDQQANAALYAHQSATRAVLAAFPLADPPPALTAGGETSTTTGSVMPDISRTSTGHAPTGPGAATTPGAPTGPAGWGDGEAPGPGGPVGTHGAGWTPLAPPSGPAHGAPGGFGPSGPGLVPGMSGVPLGFGGAAAHRRGDEQHRPKPAVPGPEPFVVPVDEDVTRGVIGAEPVDDRDDKDNEGERW